MKTKINIYAVEVDPRSTPDDQFGGDMNSMGLSIKSVKSALSRAKKESMKTTYCGKPLHEIWIEKVEDNEVVEQWAFRKGELKFHITPS